jgi:hypothetical protein
MQNLNRGGYDGSANTQENNYDVDNTVDSPHQKSLFKFQDHEDFDRYTGSGNQNRFGAGSPYSPGDDAYNLDKI